MADRGPDAAQRLSGGLYRYGHVKGVGVKDRSFVAHDRHMAVPEEQVAPPQGRKIFGYHLGANQELLHVAVTRAREAARGERDLHKPGTIDAKACLAAPQVRHADEAFCDCDEIRLRAFDGGKMAGGYAEA
jgi:hypothetical protein